MQAVGGDRGVLQGLPGNLQGQALLGVHAFGFLGRNAEEARVELIHSLDEATAHDVGLAGCLGIRMVIVGAVQTVAGHVAHRIGGIFQQAPQPLRCVGTARQPAPQAHYGDRLDRRRALAGHLFLERTDGGDCLSKTLLQLFLAYIADIVIHKGLDQ